MAKANLRAAGIAGIMLLASGCTHRIYVPVERCVRDTVREVRENIDTVIDRDSIYLEVKGDTVVKEVYRWRTRTRLRTDTVYRVRHDSVPVIIKEPSSPTPAKKVTLKERIIGSLTSGVRFLITVILLAVITVMLLRIRRK